MLHSIILSSYNRPKWVMGAIQSVKRQTHQNFQCIIVDDNSDLPTRQAIQFSTDRDERFRVIDPTIRGHHRMVEGINLAVELALGEVVHYLPDDDMFGRRRLEKADAFFRHSNEGVCYGRLMASIVPNGGRDKDKLEILRIEEHVNKGRTFYDTELTGSIDHGQVAHRKELLQNKSWDPTSPIDTPDGAFFSSLSRVAAFTFVDELFVIKRYHSLSVNLLASYQRNGIRELSYVQYKR